MNLLEKNNPVLGRGAQAAIGYDFHSIQPQPRDIHGVQAKVSHEQNRGYSREGRAMGRRAMHWLAHHEPGTGMGKRQNDQCDANAAVPDQVYPSKPVLTAYERRRNCDSAAGRMPFPKLIDWRQL
jgi:hypothetical protein